MQGWPGHGWSKAALVLGAIAWGGGPVAQGQEGPPVPAPTLPAPEPGPEVDRFAEFEARLRALEEQNRRLTEENQLFRERFQTLGVAGEGPAGGARGLGEVAPGGGPDGGMTSLEATPDSPVPSYADVTEGRSGDRMPLLGSFGQGFQFETEDEEYMLQIHLESQTDYRAFDPTGEVYGEDGFYLPRNRIIFNGRATRGLEYLFSINRGFSELNLLDAYVNFRRDDRLQLKVGRFMSPFNYEQFAVQNMWLIAPERSLFTSNLGTNRQAGLQFWGSLLSDRLDYAVGVFNGGRNTFEDFNEGKDVMAYINARPFEESEEGSLLRFLNVGGSIVYGPQNNELVPRSYRLATNASNAGTADRAAPPFLIYQPGVFERGQRSSWSAHVAYFYRSLSVIADYNGSIQRLATSRDAAESVAIPVSGYSIAAGYFLTGEELERRTIVEPLRPFRLKPGEFAPGAVEVIGRLSTFDADPVVFTSGLADRELWSNRAWVTNFGINWYPNKFLKIILDWQHGEFGDPVFYAVGKKSLTNDMLWMRCQFYY